MNNYLPRNVKYIMNLGKSRHEMDECVILRRDERKTKVDKEPKNLRQIPTVLKFSGEGY